MSVESLLGPLEIAVVISTVIFGITCLQCYMYYIEHSTNDPFPLKCLVGILMTLETFHVVLISHMLYVYSVKPFEDAYIPTGRPKSYLFQTIASVLSSTITQCFFAMRIYYLNDHHRLLPVIIAGVAILLLVSTISIMVMGLTLSQPYTPIVNALFLNIGAVRMFITTVCDMIISVGTIYYLQRNRTPLARTNRAINKLIIYTLNTGLLTTTFGLITAIILLLRKYIFTYTPFYFVMTRLYACSLISILNSRDAVQKELAHTACDAETASIVVSEADGRH